MNDRRNLFPVTALGWRWLVIGLALVMAPHLFRLPAWLSLFCLLAIAWRGARDLRGWPLPGTGLRLGLTLAGIGAVFAAFGTIIGQEAGVALLTVMLSLKLMEMATQRDAMVVVLLAYFLVAAGFLFDQSLVAGLYLLGTVVILTAALVVINHPGARAALTHDYLRRSAGLLLQALPLMAVLFILFPRVPGLGWGVAPSPSAARTGLSDSMTLGDVSDLADSREIAFRVEFRDEPPPPGSRYWRGPVLWHTDGRRWTMLSPQEMRAAGPPHPFDALGPPLDYTVSLPGDSASRWLPALDVPRLVPDKTIVTTDLQIFTAQFARTGGQTVRYTMRSYPQFQWKGLTAELRAKALALPSGVNPRTLALGQQWAVTIPAPRMRAQEALRLFREQPFYYTRRPPLLGTDPVDQFLFETRRGFCEHYAAAFVFLMRASGVPARMVTGYEGGEYNAMGDFWAVRESDAHAWTEVYLEEEGWVRIDPTTAIPPGRIETGVRAETAGDPRNPGKEAPWTRTAWLLAAQGLDAVNFQWNRWVAGYSRDRQQELLERVGLLAWGKTGMVILLAAGAAAALVGALWFGALPRRERDPAVRLYRSFCRKLARAGLGRRPREGEQAYARRVAGLRPELGDQVATVTALYQRLRYGPPAPTLLPQLQRAVAAFKP